ncbi:hypothetical protein ACFO0N_17370 [Halobium salinum]|uniref:Uncharacterized protein n=1 Tax=Halobium salinum TaxID=1364940 RepID=A0ABD5PG42_9EURY|nr:hypothetical protein [Halobium salinum]
MAHRFTARQAPPLPLLEPTSTPGSVLATLATINGETLSPSRVPAVDPPSARSKYGYRRVTGGPPVEPLSADAVPNLRSEDGNDE